MVASLASLSYLNANFAMKYLLWYTEKILFILFFFHCHKILYFVPCWHTKSCRRMLAVIQKFHEIGDAQAWMFPSIPWLEKSSNETMVLSKWPTSDFWHHFPMVQSNQSSSWTSISQRFGLYPYGSLGIFLQFFWLADGCRPWSVQCKHQWWRRCWRWQR